MPPARAPNPAAGSLNGSFVVLNLEANSVGLENAGAFRPFPLGVRASAGGGNGAGSAGDRGGACGGMDVDVVPAAMDRRGSSADREDGGRRGRKSCAGVKGERTRRREVLPSPQVSAVAPPPAGNETAGASRWSPPQYLVNLLGFFGWRIQLRTGVHGYVYVSPQGTTYSSLPKVFEIFLHANWKGGGDLLQSSPSGDLGPDGKITKVKKANSMKQIARRNNQSSVATGRAELCTRSRTRRSVSPEAVSEAKDAMEIVEGRDGETSSRNFGFVGCPGTSEEADRVIPSHGKLLQIRRSSRLSQKSSSRESALDCKGEGSCYPLFLEEEKGETTSSSDTEYEFDDGSDASTDVEVEYRQSSRRNTRELASLQKDLKNIREVEMDGEQVGGSSSSVSEKAQGGVPVDLPLQASDLVSNRKDLTVTHLEPDNKDGGNTPSGTNILFSNCGTKDFCSPAATSRLSGSMTSAPVQTSEDTKTTDHCTMTETSVCKNSNQCEKIDGPKPENNEKTSLLFTTKALTEKRSDGLHGSIQETSLGRKQSKQIQLSGSILDIGASTVVSDPSCSKTDCHAEAMAKEKVSSPPKKRKPAKGSNSKGRKKKRRSTGCCLIARTKGKGESLEDDAPQSKATILSWLIDAGFLLENEKVVHRLKNGRKQRLRGLITRGGIRCNCCKKVITLPEFDAHGGSAIYEPWINISRASGESLMQCLTTAWNDLWTQLRNKTQDVGNMDVDASDDTCGICADGGCLICCDNCSSTFHQDCLLLERIPDGCWYCPHCTCKFCKLTSQKPERNSLATDLYTCSQCYQRYHMECGTKHGLQTTNESHSLFCGITCKKVDAELSNMIGVMHPILDGFSWTLLKRLEIADSASAIVSNVKLSVALSVLEECFLPLVDRRTALDMLSQAVYNCGSHFKRLSYEGFYTAVLEKDDEIVSVATLRIHGMELAEMPFIGTQSKHRRKGMCKRLIEAIEDMLSSLHVKKLIIPSIPELLETWTSSFHFQPLNEHVRNELRNLSLVVFAETTLLQKTTSNEEIEHKVDEICQTQAEVNDIQGCADEWIEALISSDESWFTQCCNPETLKQCKDSEAIVHLENPNSSDRLDTNTKTTAEKDGPPLENSESKLSENPCNKNMVEPPNKVPRFDVFGLKSSLSLPSYDRPFTATHMGTPSWLELAEPQKTGDDSSRGHSMTVRRQLLFQ